MMNGGSGGNIHHHHHQLLPISGGSTSFNWGLIPAGFRFCPTDVELLVDYLGKKVLGLPLPMVGIIDECVYHYSPQQLTEKHKEESRENAWYFFTKRNKKSANGERNNRVITGNNVEGYWKATGKDTPVMRDDGGRKVGFKRALVFYQGKGKAATKTDWLMKEYTFASGETKLNDWVLCKIYNNKLDMSKTQSEENPNETKTKRTEKSQGIYINETRFVVPDEYGTNLQHAPQLQKLFPYSYDSTTKSAYDTTSYGDGQNPAIPYNECKHNFQHVPQLQQPFPYNYDSTTDYECGTTSYANDGQNPAIPCDECRPNFQHAPQFEQLIQCHYDCTTWNACGTTSNVDDPDLSQDDHVGYSDDDEVACLLGAVTPPDPLNGYDQPSDYSKEKVIEK